MDIKVNQVIPTTQVPENNQINGPSDEAFRFTIARIGEKVLELKTRILEKTCCNMGKGL